MIEHPRRGWVDAVTWRFSRVAMIMPAIIVVIMMYEVFMRYVLEKPTIWVNEMSLWMGGWVYLTAGIYAMQQRAHIRIVLLYDIVPRWLRRCFDVLTTFLIVVWTFMTVWGSYRESSKALLDWERYGTAWDPPIPAVTQPLILVTMVVIAIQAISNLIMDWNTAYEEADPELAIDPEMAANIAEIKRAQGVSE